MRNFKSAEQVAGGRFEITCTIIPELYDTKSNYQLIVSITKCKNVHYMWTSSFSLVIKTSRIYSIRVASSGKTSIKRTQFSADD